MITLKAKDIKISTGGPLIAILNHVDAEKLDLQALDRIKIQHGRKSRIAAIDISETSNGIRPGQIGLFKELVKELNIKKATKLKVSAAKIPRSIEVIKKKLDGKELTKKEIEGLIKDLVNNELTEIEITYFVSACYQSKLNFRETEYLTDAISRFGDKIKIKEKIMADKHSIGGIPNNRTTMLIIPIVTAAGITMIKTSSRSITSPSGTADTMEAIAKVSFTTEKIKEIVRKVKGCMVWGGALDLVSADEKLIKVRHPLRLDPQGIMLASILAKKLAVNSTHILIDIPVGKTAKVESKKEAKLLKKSFEKLGKHLGMKTKVMISNGDQPIGNGVGPNLEARDVLYILRKDPKAPKDLEKKAIYMANLIFKLTKTKASAKEILDSGRAYQQFMRIIEAQEGNPKITPEDIKVGKFSYKYRASKSGKIKEIDNKKIAKIAKIAGAPHDKDAGLYLHKKVKDEVKRGQILMTIYADSRVKLNYAKTFVKGSIII
jgi:AMP phosphorylase